MDKPLHFGYPLSPVDMKDDEMVQAMARCPSIFDLLIKVTEFALLFV
jgi:hypothetical protein